MGLLTWWSRGMSQIGVRMPQRIATNRDGKKAVILNHTGVCCMSWVYWAWAQVRTVVHILVISPRVPNLPSPKLAAFGWTVRVEEEKRVEIGERSQRRGGGKIAFRLNTRELFTTSRAQAGINDVCISLLSLEIVIELIWKLNFWFISGSCHYRFKLLKNECILSESFSSRNGVAWDSTFEICIISFRTVCIWGKPKITGITSELMKFKSIFYKQLDT